MTLVHRPRLKQAKTYGYVRRLIHKQGNGSLRSERLFVCLCLFVCACVRACPTYVMTSVMNGKGGVQTTLCNKIVVHEVTESKHVCCFGEMLAGTVGITKLCTVVCSGVCQVRE
jgi:hypothetical protein